MKHIYIFLMLLLSYGITNAQQETILTKYTFNSLFFNPAYAGSTGEDMGSAILQYRSQWLGVEGAPNTLLLGAENSFFDNSLGLGVTLAQEGIGSDRNTEVALNSTYRIELSRDAYLSGGIRTGFSYISSDFSNLTIQDAGDVFDLGTENLSLFSVGAGIMYHDEVFNIGFSIPTIVSIGEGSINRTSHVYGHLGVKIGDEYSSIKWQPSLLVKYQKAVPLQLTLGVQAWLLDRFAPGLHWRLDESIALSFEMKVTQDLSFTAAYDFTTNDLHDYTTGSIEVMVRYVFGGDGTR